MPVRASADTGGDEEVFARNQDRQQALQAGFQLHLTKPIDATTLVAAVASLGGKLDGCVDTVARV